MALEQIPVAGEHTENKEQKNTWKEKILENANVQNSQNSNESFVDRNLTKQEANNQSTEAAQNPESKKQIDQLLNVWNRINQLTPEQQLIYKNLMITIRAELDKDAPTIIDMKKEIDVNYYNKHPEEAAKMADEIAKDANNMWDVELVLSVVSRKDYLSDEHQQKLDKVLNEVFSNLDDATKNLLEK